MALGFIVTCIRQMTTSKPQHQGCTLFVNLPLFLTTLTRKETSSDIFKLTDLSHVVMKVEAQLNVTTAKCSGTSGQTADSPHVVYGVVAAMSINS